MIDHFGAHPETQVSVMMENNEIMAKYRHKGKLERKLSACLYFCKIYCQQLKTPK